MSKNKKAFRGNTSPAQLVADPQFAESTVQVTPAIGEPRLPYNKIPGEVVQQNGDAYVVLGKDKLDETNCWSIDLVTGRGGDVGQEISQLDKTKTIDRSFYLDSARVYISQRTDVDDRFGLTPLYKNKKKRIKEGPSKNKSAIALKADGVRLIAREGIKLITMTDETNSTNNTITGKYGIDLIAGANVDEVNYDLQPLVKGDNMVEAMSKILEHLAQLDTQFAMVDKIIGQILSAFTTHSHVSGVPVTGPPVDPNSVAQNILSGIDLIMQVGEINLRQFNHAQYTLDYLLDGSPTYICSPQNKTT